MDSPEKDHGLVGYRVPREWLSLPESQRGLRTIGAFKKVSRAVFLAEYAAFVCENAMCGVYGSEVWLSSIARVPWW